MIVVTHATQVTGTNDDSKQVSKNAWNAGHSLAGLSGDTGAPNNANGQDGDIYLRVDGGVLTTIYQKRAGAWVGIV